ncbi:methyltransferase domain-containing protein [Leptospira sp. 96542]|nr:methyltransferase domain-containing protein [Leptospira sp. 96542]
MKEMSVPTCHVCGHTNLELLYEMQSGLALTSLGTAYPGDTRVWACVHCSHLQTDEIEHVAQYYADDYNILSSSAEEDQIYEIREGTPVYRTEHQLTVLQALLELQPNARVLDYGCAKSSTMKALLLARPDLQVHLFDVSENYKKFWSSFLPEDRWATFTPKAEWAQSFDVVTSFFALEHIVDPLGSLRKIHSLLRPGGHFYCVVPNVATNVADFIVVDHVNHFTEGSWTHLLQRAGFVPERIDATSHRGAFVVTARRLEVSPPLSLTDGAAIAKTMAEFKQMADFWRGAAARVTNFADVLHSQACCAIYGAGFYGAFIAASLGGVERIRCFVDQNPHLQGTTIFGRPVVAPSALDPSVDTLLVGLNPAHARRTIGEIQALRSRPLTYFYL